MKVYYRDHKVELMTQVIDFKRQYEYENQITPNVIELTSAEYITLESEIVDGVLMDMEVVEV